MDNKRMEIMESAIKLFSRRGYYSTSMQEIAADSSMSKGSLYKHFDSKEDLLIQVFKYNHDKMVQTAKCINIDESLKPKEKFKKMMVIEFNGVLENKDYFSLISKSLPTDENKHFGPLMRQIRAEMMDWHKEMLTQVYGQEIEANIWDLVILIQGIIKEYIYLIMLDEKEIDSTRVADFVLFSVEAIIHHGPKPKPVLTRDRMKEYENLSMEWEPISVEVRVIELLNQIKVKINQCNVEEGIKQDLYSSVNLLVKEVKKNEPRVFLIRALLSYLDENIACKHEVMTIKKSLDITEK